MALQLHQDLKPESRKTRADLWTPIPKSPQWAAQISEADELYYGGAAGGGKTDLILGLAIEDHQRSLILRREYSQTKDMQERSRDIIGTAGRFNENLHLWRGLPRGARIEFGGVKQESDWRKFAGRPRDLMAFDELPEFTESQYRSLIAWNRSTDPDQRVRVVGAGNPPTDDDGAWVIDYWAPWLDEDYDNPAAPGELRWFARIDDEDIEVDGPKSFKHAGETIHPRSRTFIPAFLEDNPYLRDTDYGAVLQALPEPLRSQLLRGDFTATRTEDAFVVVPRAWIEAAFERHEKWGRKAKVQLTAVGVDPIRGGKDRMVIYKRRANYFEDPEVYTGDEVKDGPAAAAKVLKSISKPDGSPMKDVRVNLDPIGIGSSPLDILHANDIPVEAVNFAAAAKDFNGEPLTDRSGKFKFRNVRTAALWKFREALDPEHGDDLAIPRNRDLRRDLLAHRWELSTAGIQVTPKKDVIDRTGRSPDHSDAIVLCNWTETLVGSWDEVSDLGSVDDYESRWT